MVYENKNSPEPSIKTADSWNLGLRSHQLCPSAKRESCPSAGLVIGDISILAALKGSFLDPTRSTSHHPERPPTSAQERDGQPSEQSLLDRPSRADGISPGLSRKFSGLERKDARALTETTGEMSLCFQGQDNLRGTSRNPYRRKKKESVAKLKIP